MPIKQIEKGTNFLEAHFLEKKKSFCSNKENMCFRIICELPSKEIICVCVVWWKMKTELLHDVIEWKWVWDIVVLRGNKKERMEEEKLVSWVHHQSSVRWNIFSPHHKHQLQTINYCLSTGMRPWILKIGLLTNIW